MDKHKSTRGQEYYDDPGDLYDGGDDDDKSAISNGLDEIVQGVRISSSGNYPIQPYYDPVSKWMPKGRTRDLRYYDVVGTIDRESTNSAINIAKIAKKLEMISQIEKDAKKKAWKRYGDMIEKEESKKYTKDITPNDSVSQVPRIGRDDE